MKLDVVRTQFGVDATNSIFFVDGKFEAYGLEDEVRTGQKVMGETAIPLGEYKIKFRKEGGWFNREKARYDKKFGEGWFQGMLELQDVPNFTFVLIHSGNTDEATSACYIIGDTQQDLDVSKDGFIGSSRNAYEKFYPKARDALLAGEEVTIKYSNINLNEIVADAVTKLSNKSPQNMIGATDIYEKISEINGNLKTLEAKLEGKNIIQLWGSPMKITCPKCKTELLYVSTNTKWVCGNKKCIDYNRRQFGGTVEEEQETMKNKEYWKFILSKAFRTGLQSAISLYLANTSGIIDANALELIGVAFLSSFLSVIQNGLEQKNPKYSYEG